MSADKVVIDGDFSIQHQFIGDLNVFFSATSLDFETGTWTTDTNTNTADIVFVREHVGAPFFVALVDATNSVNDTKPSNQAYYIFNVFNLFGTEIFRNENDKAKYFSTYWTLTASSNPMLSPQNNRGSADPIFITNTGFRALISTSSNWCANRTYKWIAIWKART